ncbi:MAG: carbohydrate kinase [Bacteroidales bacterium]|nr:carbohydrate kinase [Bacteroidales bacterium]
MKKEFLQKILSDISRVRIAVIGDFCLDAYWFIDESVSEISIETGEPTRPVREQRYSLGGAGNVANNLVSMGVGDVRTFGVTGKDPFGVEMEKIMQEKGIDTGNLIIQDSCWHTHTYSKPYIEERELSRIDFGNFNELSVNTADRLISNLVETIPSVDLILINQQVSSGIHTEYLRRKLLDVIRKFPDKFFITDSRNFNEHYEGTIRKMNDFEAVRLCGYKRGPDDRVPFQEVRNSALMLYERFRKPLFITRGDRGSITVDDSGIFEIPSLMILSPVDTVGAGDSYLAGAAAALASGYSVKIAAEFGTLVAGVTVQKLFQTGTASPDEILGIGHDPDYVYSPDLAEDIRQAKYFNGSEIEIINRLPASPRIKHAIFDHDGTISTLREGWELIMAPMMVRAILGDKFNDTDESVYRKVQTRVWDYIDKTTGMQTITQMMGLPSLIREFGFVPEKRILDGYEYKKIYNDELIGIVRDREKKLKNNELNREDFMVKNVLPFIEFLNDRGIVLYLASGTDEEDVRNEANTLGYGHFFGEHIYGADNNIEGEAKKRVLDKILDNIGESSADLIVTFGDGPVEIRETGKRGGITVGVASNEIRRYGLNEKKRERLVKAGADLIIPDFSQLSVLLSLLNIS